MPQSTQGMHASMGGAFTAQSYDSSEVLPFELHVLEAALGEVRKLTIWAWCWSAGHTALWDDGWAQPRSRCSVSI